QAKAPLQRLALQRGLADSPEPAPSPRPWISARARPLADHFESKERSKSLTRSVTFFRDPTTPISVTLLNDLTGSATATLWCSIQRYSPSARRTRASCRKGSP